MNLCGGGVEQQLGSPLCGPCTKEEDPNESILSDDDASLLETCTDGVVQRIALDHIQTTMDPIVSDEEYISGLQQSLTSPALKKGLATSAFLPRKISPRRGRLREKLRRETMRSPPRTRETSVSSNLTIACSPSPLLLNPLSHDDWDSQRNSRKTVQKPNLVEPAKANNPSSAMDKLMQRLEEGFRLALLESSSQLPAVSNVFLHLNKERDRLCINCHDDEEKKTDGQNLREIPIAKIMRLEVRKRDPTNPGAPGRGFSVIANEDANIKYYDFVAASALDREVLLSTLVVVLEQIHNPLEMRPNALPCIPPLPDEGTMDQPILCSPSLEETKLPDEDSMKTKTSLVATVASREVAITPRRDLRPVIDVEKVDDCSVRKLDLPFGLSMTSFQSNRPLRPSLTEEERRLVERTDESRPEYTPANKPQQLNASWCDEDVCTLALRDMANTCSGIFDQKNTSTVSSPVANGAACTSLGAEQAAMVEEYIASALGAPSAVYSYLATAGRDVWEAGQEPTQEGVLAEKGSKAPSAGGVRNRASQLNAQASRLKNLRNEMTFAAALKDSQEKMRYVQTTQSCDDLDRRGYNGEKARAAEAILDRFHTSALLQTVVGNMKADKEGFQEDGGMEGFYDSDPEDARPVTTKRNPRQAIIPSSKTLERPRRQRALSGAGFDKRGSGKRISKKMNEDVIVQLVQAMNNERLLLMWHPSQTKKNPNQPPACVNFWIESGVYLVDGSFLLPKLTWTRVSVKNTGQQLKIAEGGLNKLDLLDICRIRPAQRINREFHPFADRRKCFEVETQKGSFLFESESSEERDRIVYGLKLVVARLASLLMLRDFRAAEEFFGQVASGVPGEAPTWATGKDQAET